MLKNSIKLVGTLAKASKTKSAPDVIKAGTETIGFANKIAKKKKKDESKRKQQARR